MLHQRTHGQTSVARQHLRRWLLPSCPRSNQAIFMKNKGYAQYK